MNIFFIHSYYSITILSCQTFFKVLIPPSFPRPNRPRILPRIRHDLLQENCQATTRTYYPAYLWQSLENFKPHGGSCGREFFYWTSTKPPRSDSLPVLPVYGGITFNISAHCRFSSYSHFAGHRNRNGIFPWNQAAYCLPRIPWQLICGAKSD